uniref:Uncharacterized protein n=1 Tax=Coccidioides posadasii RMSCC 3488 TaxID=454284 RepID=A0A0J6FS42_COCPO|nr:hypothetical protein CPAG_08547 [Coccidioides posadasii RMSCC 3488]
MSVQKRRTIDHQELNALTNGLLPGPRWQTEKRRLSRSSCRSLLIKAGVNDNWLDDIGKQIAEMQNAKIQKSRNLMSKHVKPLKTESSSFRTSLTLMARIMK